MSVNKVILIGRLGRDPETRYMPSGEGMTSFSMATDEQWKDKGGLKQSRTEWHNITLFGKLGEIASQYLRKGSQVFIEGRIQSRKYTDKNGIERTAYNIIGSELKMLGGGNGEAQQQQSYAPPPAPPKRQVVTPAEPVSDIDDDIPF